MYYRDNEPRATGWFINASRVQQFTSAYPDTTFDYSDLKDLPFNELRKGFPRDPTLHVSQSVKKLPVSLAVRLADPPNIGHIISDTKPVDTLRYTSTNPVDLIGDDFEMSEVNAEGDVNNVEIRADDFPRDGSTVASLRTLEDREMTLAEIAGSVPGAADLMQGAGIAADGEPSGDMLTKAMESLKMTLPDTRVADDLHAALSKHDAGVERSDAGGMPAAAVDLFTSLLPIPPGSPEASRSEGRRADSGALSQSFIGEETSGAAAQSGPSGATSKRIDARRGSQQEAQSDVSDVEPQFAWISTEPSLMSKYKVYDLTPDRLLSKICQLSSTLYQLIESNSPDYFNHIPAFRDLEWLESGRAHLIRDIEEDMMSTEDDSSPEVTAQRDLQVRLHTCARDLYILPGMENVISLTPASMLTHMAIALKWNLIADKQVVTDISRKMAVMGAQTEDFFKEHADKLLAVHTSISDGIETISSLSVLFRRYFSVSWTPKISVSIIIPTRVVSSSAAFPSM